MTSWGTKRSACLFSRSVLCPSRVKMGHVAPRGASWRKTPEGVVITLTDEQFNELILLLGYAAAEAVTNVEPWPMDRALRIVNAINEGNPKWHQYKISGGGGGS